MLSIFFADNACLGFQSDNVKKIFFLVRQVLSFRLKNQTSKNIADTTFK